MCTPFRPHLTAGRNVHRIEADAGLGCAFAHAFVSGCPRRGIPYSTWSCASSLVCAPVLTIRLPRLPMPPLPSLSTSGCTHRCVRGTSARQRGRRRGRDRRGGRRRRRRIHRNVIGLCCNFQGRRTLEPTDWQIHGWWELCRADGSWSNVDSASVRRPGNPPDILCGRCARCHDLLPWQLGAPMHGRAISIRRWLSKVQQLGVPDWPVPRDLHLRVRLVLQVVHEQARGQRRNHVHQPREFHVSQ